MLKNSLKEKKTHQAAEIADSPGTAMRVRQLSTKSNGSSKSSANETLTKTPENKMQRAGSAKCPNSARRLERKSLMESFGQASSPAFQLNKGFMKKPITVGKATKTFSY